MKKESERKRAVSSDLRKNLLKIFIEKHMRSKGNNVILIRNVIWWENY